MQQIYKFRKFLSNKNSPEKTANKPNNEYANTLGQ